MLWKDYILKSGDEVFDLWESLFSSTPNTKLIYIAGAGFDKRSQDVVKHFVSGIENIQNHFKKLSLVLVEFQPSQMDDHLKRLAEENVEVLKQSFERLQNVKPEIKKVDVSHYHALEEGPFSFSVLKNGTEDVLREIKDYDHIILDVSTFPRVMFLSLLIGILVTIIEKGENPLRANGKNFQILVAEDPELDGKIESDVSGSKVVYIPGLGGVSNYKDTSDLSTIWFPIPGESKGWQFKEISKHVVPTEICPVLPHPSKNPRRLENLLLANEKNFRDVDEKNIILAHESNPFEAYREILSTMRRYRDIFSILGGCYLYVSPFSSKLMSLAAGLACFNFMLDNRMKEEAQEDKVEYQVAIPCIQTTDYKVSEDDIRESKSKLFSLLLTGEAFSE